MNRIFALFLLVLNLSGCPMAFGQPLTGQFVAQASEPGAAGLVGSASSPAFSPDLSREAHCGPLFPRLENGSQSSQPSVAASFPFGITAFAATPGSHTTLTLDAKALADLRMDEVVWPSQDRGFRAASTMVHEATPWNRLAGWKIGPGNQVASVPTNMGGFQEARLSLVGFMFPLTGGEETREFLLLPSIEICCYGSRPPLNQLVRVETSVPVRFERILPVVVEGIWVWLFWSIIFPPLFKAA